MVTPELMAQVKAQLASGMKRADIEQILRVAGIEEADMANVFTLIEMAKGTNPAQTAAIDPAVLVEPITSASTNAPLAPPAVKIAPPAPPPISPVPAAPPAPPIVPPAPPPPSISPPPPKMVPVSPAAASSSAIPRAIVTPPAPPPPPRPPAKNMTATTPVARAAIPESPVQKKSSSRAGTWIATFVVIVVVMATGGLVAFEKIDPQAYRAVLQEPYRIPPLYSIAQEYLGAYIPFPDSEETVRLDALYAKYCAADVAKSAQITLPLSVASSSFSEISDAIEKAKSDNHPAHLALLFDELTILAQADVAATQLGEDAIGAKAEDAFTQQFSPIAQELKSLFAAFEKSGLTPDAWLEKVPVDVQDHTVTDVEFTLYSIWYEKTRNDAFVRLSSAQKNRTEGELLRYLAELHELLNAISAAREMLAQGAQTETNKKIAEATVASTMQLLEEGSPQDRAAGFLLSLLGVSILKEKKDFDLSLRYQRCAAEKYFDTFSMYNLGGYYGRGVDSATYPELSIKAPLSKDMKTAYYWNMALVLTDSVEYGLFADSRQALGASTAAAIEGIQKAGGLTQEELVMLEDGAYEFVAQKYPEVTVSGFEVPAPVQSTTTPEMKAMEAEVQ